MPVERMSRRARSGFILVDYFTSLPLRFDLSNNMVDNRSIVAVVPFFHAESYTPNRCRQALILVDNSGIQFLVSGPLIKCKLCNSWVEKSKMADHAMSNHSDLLWKMRADEGRTKI